MTVVVKVTDMPKTKGFGAFWHCCYLVDKYIRLKSVQTKMTQ